MNWSFTFVFSDFPNHLLNAFWDHFFMDFYQSGRILSHSAVFMLLCVLLHHFFSVFCSYVNHLNMPFASSWHNVVLLELSTLFVKLRLIFVSFSHFSLNFCIVSFPFFAYNKLNTTFRTDSSPPGDPWKEFYHMKHSKKLVTLSVLTTMSGAAIYFLNKTLDTAAIRKNLLAATEKEIFSWQFGDIFSQTQKIVHPTYDGRANDREQKLSVHPDRLLHSIESRFLHWYALVWQPMACLSVFLKQSVKWQGCQRKKRNHLL